MCGKISPPRIIQAPPPSFLSFPLLYCEGKDALSLLRKRTRDLLSLSLSSPLSLLPSSRNVLFIAFLLIALAGRGPYTPPPLPLLVTHHQLVCVCMEASSIIHAHVCVCGRCNGGRSSLLVFAAAAASLMTTPTAHTHTERE